MTNRIRPIIGRECSLSRAGQSKGNHNFDLSTTRKEQFPNTRQHAKGERLFGAPRDNRRRFSRHRRKSKGSVISSWPAKVWVELNGLQITLIEEANIRCLHSLRGSWANYFYVWSGGIMGIDLSIRTMRTGHWRRIIPRSFHSHGNSSVWWSTYLFIEPIIAPHKRKILIGRELQKKIIAQFEPVPNQTLTEIAQRILHSCLEKLSIGPITRFYNLFKRHAQWKRILKAVDNIDESLFSLFGPLTWRLHLSIVVSHDTRVLAQGPLSLLRMGLSPTSNFSLAMFSFPIQNNPSLIDQRPLGRNYRR